MIEILRYRDWDFKRHESKRWLNGTGFPKKIKRRKKIRTNKREREREKKEEEI